MYFKYCNLKSFTPLLAAYLLFSSCQHRETDNVETDNLQGSISISGAFALYPMAVEWTNEFSARHPAVRIDLSSGGAGKGMTDVINGMVDFAMLSREPHDEEREKGAIDFTVAKDAVLPVFSSSNPLRDKILEHAPMHAAQPRRLPPGLMRCRRTWAVPLSMETPEYPRR